MTRSDERGGAPRPTDAAPPAPAERPVDRRTSVERAAPAPDEPAAIERQVEAQQGIERESLGAEVRDRDSIELPAADLPDDVLEGDV